MIGSPTPPPRPRVTSPSPSRSLSHQLWTPRPVTPPRQHRERSAADVWLSHPTPSPLTIDNKFGPLPPDVLKKISPPSDADSLDSLSPTHLTKRKKYADSSFFDDSSHNYPTVEEQIKMARGVAQSLTAPANQATRGHRMFMKRKEKSVNWTVDDTNTPRRPSIDAQSEDLYYNPEPKKAMATWKPRPGDFSTTIMSPSPVPRLFAPRFSPAASDEKAKYMSAEEFERMLLFEDKTTHDTVPPQLCFGLAADLRESASKGGRMFARRRASADQWTVTNDSLPRFQVSKLAKSANIVRGRRHSEPDYDEVTSRTPRETPASELPVPRAMMSPWDAAVQFGHVEPAFQHLNTVTTTSSSSSFIPHQTGSSLNQRGRRANGVATGDLSSSHNLYLTSPVNDSKHINTDDDAESGHYMTSSHFHQQPHHFSQALPWQRDVSRTPSYSNGTYRPVPFYHFS